MNFSTTNFEHEFATLSDGHEIVLQRTVQDSLFKPVVSGFSPENVASVIVAREIGPCGGVQAATLGAEVLAEDFGGDQPVYVNARITNGADSNRRLEDAGVYMGSDARSVANDAVFAVGAHGNERDYATAIDRGAIAFDLTCIYVDRTHKEVEGVAKRVGEDGIPTGIVFLSLDGRADHAEFVGTRNRAEDVGLPFHPIFSEDEIVDLIDELQENEWERIRIISQTTNDSDLAELTADSIFERIKQHRQLSDKIDVDTFEYNREDVCRTVMLRQRATREIVREYDVDTLIVLGSHRSKNTKNLVKVAISEAELRARLGVRNTLGRIVMLNTHLDLQQDLSGRLGIVSGASIEDDNVKWVLNTLDPGSRRIYVGESDRDRPGQKVFPLPIRGRDRDNQAYLNRRIRELARTRGIL